MKIPGDTSVPGIFLVKFLLLGNKSITFIRLKYSELLRMLKQDGWYVVRQAGSHLILRHEIKSGILNVPFHGSKEMSKGLLRATLKKAQITTTKR